MQAPKDWGGLRTINTNRDNDGGAVPRRWSCEPRPMALVDPPPACQRDLKLLSGGAMEVKGRREQAASYNNHHQPTTLEVRCHSHPKKNRGRTLNVPPDSHPESPTTTSAPKKRIRRS